MFALLIHYIVISGLQGTSEYDACYLIFTLKVIKVHKWETPKRKAQSLHHK